MGRSHQISWRPKEKVDPPSNKRGFFLSDDLWAGTSPFFPPLNSNWNRHFGFQACCCMKCSYAVRFPGSLPLDLTGLYCWLSWVHNLETSFRLGDLPSSEITWASSLWYTFFCIYAYSGFLFVCFSKEPWPTRPFKKMKQEGLTKNSTRVHIY